MKWKDERRREIHVQSKGEERELGQEVIFCESFTNPLFASAKPKWTT